MYKCERCESEFEHPDIVEFSNIGWKTGCCPECGCEDYHTVKPCLKCGENFDPDELINGFCENCANELYTEEIGLKYITSESYILKDALSYIYDCDCDDNMMCEALHQHFIKYFNNKSYNFKKALKEYCFDDLDHFIQFVKERAAYGNFHSIAS